MAQAATPVDNCAYDPAQGGSPYCRGWLQGFKKATLGLQCKGFDGQSHNCWDIISALPIHCYARTGGECLQKIQGYHDTFLEDFEGSNGRTKKTLWLTEVAAGSNEATVITKFVDDLLNSQTGLTNRATYGYVEKVSWFSEWSFPSFKVGSYTPHKDEVWSSSLFEPTTGRFTPVGEHFVAQCGSVVPGPAPTPTPPPPPTPTPAPPTPPSPTPPSPTHCKVGDPVHCPGFPATQICGGNQCCPDGSTCPSADNTFKLCPKPKRQDCTVP